MQPNPSSIPGAPSAPSIPTSSRITQGPQEAYTNGYGEEHRSFLSMRSALQDADFFLPYLRPGMQVIDCGCGQGAITVGLAEAVAPGEVVGIDRELSQIEAARIWVKEHNVANVRFEVGNIYELPFPDASVDATFAHTVLEHLSDPARALKEMRRVLKPGGIIGIKDPDYASMIHESSSPLTGEAIQLYRRVSEKNGASPYYARHQRRLLREAGFERTAGFAYAVGGGNDQMSPYFFALSLRPWFHDPAFVDTARAQGWADQPQLAAMLQALEEAFTGPDAFFALTLCAAIGWVPEA
jgi:ubiquinone/menaquinone biosynthesis C-methylase UbiE